MSHLEKKQLNVGQIAITAIITGIVMWQLSSLLNAPGNSATAIAEVNKDVAVLQKSDNQQDQSINEIKGDIKYIRGLMDQWASKQGISVKQ
jgi:hypothetical protein